MDKNLELVERIKRLLDGREKYPWGQEIGLGKGVIDGMTRTGAMPGGETLAVIRRYENARIDWLLEGRGAPYSVTVCASDASAVQVIEELTGDETWEVTLVSDRVRIAAVLTQPGSYDVRDGKDKDDNVRFRRIDYTIVEVIAGALGTEAITTIVTRFAHGQGISMLYYVAVDQHTMNQLEAGQIGTYRLCHSPDAVLKAREVTARNGKLFPPIERNTDPVMTPDEANLLELYRAMKPENRLAVNQVATAMAEYSKAAKPQEEKPAAPTRTKKNSPV